MDPLLQAQLSNDSNTNAKCIQPNLPSTNEIQTSFEELCDQQPTCFRKCDMRILASRDDLITCLGVLLILATETQDVEQLINSGIADQKLVLWGGVIPISLVVTPRVNNHGIQQQPESSEFRNKSLPG
jgi:hypothetical protein